MNFLVQNEYKCIISNALKSFDTIMNYFSTLIITIHNSSFYIIFLVFIGITLYSILANEEGRIKKFIHACAPAISFILLNTLLGFLKKLCNLFELVGKYNVNCSPIERNIFFAAYLYMLLYFLMLFFDWEYHWKNFGYNLLLLMVFVIVINSSFTEMISNTLKQNYINIVNVLIATKNGLILFHIFLALIMTLKYFLKEATTFYYVLLVAIVSIIDYFFQTIKFTE